MRLSRGWALVLLLAAVALPAGVLRIVDVVNGIHLSPGVSSLVFGGGIVAAAFLISWAAEAAQKDISQTMALAFLALIAVLPEYSVDIYLAWQAGQDPSGPYVHYATANMTGANRLLVGFGWPLVALLFWMRRRRSVQLERGISLEILFLGLATLYALTIPFKGGVAVWDAAVLFTLFGLYIWIGSKAERLEPELMGPAAAIGALATRHRRIAITAIFVYCALIILACAEPFAEGIIEVGTDLGVDQFLMVQWVAPLASETPEILVAAIFAIRGQAAAAMTMLISSKVNQWTLLVGSLPVVYSVSSGTLTSTGMPLDSRQSEEIWLTAAQALLAVCILLRRSFGGVAALVLLVLWGTQLGFTEAAHRWAYVGVYGAFAFGVVALDRRRLRGAMRLVPETLDIFRRPARRADGEEHPAGERPPPAEEENKR
ncbi:MAG: hypothetical protein EXR48_01910 [Dehalococcoidia bacterium]|nr:hypothetical protein [Dehalococcoidia bacterium]